MRFWRWLLNGNNVGTSDRPVGKHLPVEGSPSCAKTRPLFFRVSNRDQIAPNCPIRHPVWQIVALQRRCCTARSKLLTSLCRWQSHPAQYVSGIPSAAILLSISHPIRCSTRCLANVRVRISGPMIAL